MDIKIGFPKTNYTKTITATLITTLIITGFLTTNCDAVTNVKVNSDGFLVVDSKPELIIGLYESFLPKDDEMVKELADNGFNFARTRCKRDYSRFLYNETKADLDIFHKYGLYGWIYLPYTGLADQEKRIEPVEIVKKFKDHPALLAWELRDEILWHIWYKPLTWTFGEQQKDLRKLIKDGNFPEERTKVLKAILKKANSYAHRGLWGKSEKLYDKLRTILGGQPPASENRLSQRQTQSKLLIAQIKEICDAIKQVDPVHFTWTNYAPCNSIKTLKQASQVVDMISCDIYPAPEYRTLGQSNLKNKTLSSVGEFTKRMRVAASDKPVFMILQGFGWRDLKGNPSQNSDDLQWGRRPNLHELRFMVYDAIVNGANGILYWGVHYAGYTEKNNQLRKDIFKVSKELRALESAVLDKRSEKIPTVTIDDTHAPVDGPELQMMLRKTGKDWVLIVTNTSTHAIPFTLSDLPDSLNGKKLYLLHSDEHQDIKNGSLNDGITGYGVHVYATSRRFEVK
ncbi:MAG: hypothetical protein ACYSSI_08300 [Planctomycetota bacterium]|jgi:hypothetical protein